MLFHADIIANALAINQKCPGAMRDARVQVEKHAGRSAPAPHMSHHHDVASSDATIRCTRTKRFGLFPLLLQRMRTCFEFCLATETAAMLDANTHRDQIGVAICAERPTMTCLSSAPLA